MMKKALLYSLIFGAVLGCKNPSGLHDQFKGAWLGSLTVKDGNKIDFSMEIKPLGDQWQMTLYNDRETIVYDQVRIEGDSLWIALAPYDAVIKAKYERGVLTGVYHKEDLNRITPFSAVPQSYVAERPITAPSIQVGGSWKAEFYPKEGVIDRAQADLVQVGSQVSGTVRTPTGDYRYLSGYVFGDSLRLSTFDGAHPYLFLAKNTDRGLAGQFYYENHMQTPFLWTQDEAFSLDQWMEEHPSASSDVPVSFAFKDTEGNLINYPVSVWENKVVVLLNICGMRKPAAV